MSHKPTKQELANCEPGICVTCGQWSRFRDTGGNCNDCHNKAYHAYKEARKADIEKAKEEGRKVWASVGIKPGDKVKRFCVSWFGLGGEEVIGIAKVGACGAYVASPYQPGKLDHRGWQKV